MKNKSLFITIIVGMSMIIGMKDLFISIIGEHYGIITMAVVALLYQIFVMIAKLFYNTGNWTKGWTKPYVIMNVLLAISLAVGIFINWTPTVGITLNNSATEILAKIVVGCNAGIALVSADWKVLIASWKVPDELG